MSNVLIPEQEIWADVPGFEGLYKVSSFGRVKSMSRPVYRKLINGYVSLKPRILKYLYNGDGYKQVQLYRQGRKKTFPIHTLTFFTFNPHINKKQGYEVDHIDNDKENNNLTNLQYIKSRHNSTKRSINRRKSSMFTGVSWSDDKQKWQAHIRHNSKSYYLGRYQSEIEAHHAYLKALSEIEQGVFFKKLHEPASKYKGVQWNKDCGKWTARYKGIYLGLFKTEIDAHHAYQKAESGIIKPRKVKTSQYRGICFNKGQGYWFAYAKGKYVGRYKTEQEAYEAQQQKLQ